MVYRPHLLTGSYLSYPSGHSTLQKEYQVPLSCCVGPRLEIQCPYELKELAKNNCQIPVEPGQTIFLTSFLPLKLSSLEGVPLHSTF